MRFYPKNCGKREGCKCSKCCKKECPDKKWEKREGCKCSKCSEVEIKTEWKDDCHKKKWNCHDEKWKDDCRKKKWNCYDEKWKDDSHKKKWNCNEVKWKDDCHEKKWKDDCHEKKCKCHDEKWKDDCHEKKCKCHDEKWKDDCHEKKCKENDCNCWIREKLDDFIGRRVVIFTNDATYTEGTIQDVKKDCVILVPKINYIIFEPVKVFSNSSDILLEEFQKYCIRLDDIVGFGKDSCWYT
ncbi:hypothetical protein [Paenisporosarcina sp. OV554]|uniref:hypothetical protein n=1 Tax=Paenisporosarcina sp. OV554 TaxID=2135694 RepID=UPI000D40C617|nr:hypothetical protein [Paenisporosarcina sp. OV554]PUB15129.1 hypothetical protein C8K15_10444 [Paenisporosarcina sp. OV554]